MKAKRMNTFFLIIATFLFAWAGCSSHDGNSKPGGRGGRTTLPNQNPSGQNPPGGDQTGGDQSGEECSSTKSCTDSTKTCKNGKCVTSTPGGGGPGTGGPIDCGGVTCPNITHTCYQGNCVDLRENCIPRCGAGYQCVPRSVGDRASCQPSSAGGPGAATCTGCTPEQVCEGGKCVERTSCAGVTCTGNNVCEAGKCVAESSHCEEWKSYEKVSLPYDQKVTIKGDLSKNSSTEGAKLSCVTSPGAGVVVHAVKFTTTDPTTLSWMFKRGSKSADFNGYIGLYKGCGVGTPVRCEENRLFDSGTDVELPEPGDYYLVVQTKDAKKGPWVLDLTLKKDKDECKIGVATSRSCKTNRLIEVCMNDRSVGHNVKKEVTCPLEGSCTANGCAGETCQNPLELDLSSGKKHLEGNFLTYDENELPFSKDSCHSGIVTQSKRGPDIVLHVKGLVPGKKLVVATQQEFQDTTLYSGDVKHDNSLINIIRFQTACGGANLCQGMRYLSGSNDKVFEFTVPDGVNEGYVIIQREIGFHFSYDIELRD